MLYQNQRDEATLRTEIELAIWSEGRIPDSFWEVLKSTAAYKELLRGSIRGAEASQVFLELRERWLQRDSPYFASESETNKARKKLTQRASEHETEYRQNSEKYYQAYFEGRALRLLVANHARVSHSDRLRNWRHSLGPSPSYREAVAWLFQLSRAEQKNPRVRRRMLKFYAYYARLFDQQPFPEDVSAPFRGEVVIEYFDERDVVPYYDPWGHLAMLDQFAKSLAETYQWQLMQATAFILLDHTPDISESRASVNPNPIIPALSRIEMSIDPRMSPLEVASLYEEHRKEIYGHRHKGLSLSRLSTMLLAIGGIGASAKDWADRMAVHNKHCRKMADKEFAAVPFFGKPYRDVKRFRQELLKAIDLLLDPQGTNGGEISRIILGEPPVRRTSPETTSDSSDISLHNDE